MRLLWLLLALSVALTAGADHHRSKRGVAEYITNLLYRASDIVFRSFAEASGYKVTRLPPKASEKSFSEHHSEEKSSGRSHTKEKKTSFATTTERVVTHGESFSTKSGPHKTDFNFYSEEENSDFDHWASKKPEHDGGNTDFKVWINNKSDDDDKSDHEEESNKVLVKKKRPSRIKIHRKGEEETVHSRHVNKEGPNLGLGGFGSARSGLGSAHESTMKKPMIIRVLTPTPAKKPEGSLEDSWPSVWRGAH